jgi:signal transduction histidine kinase
MSRRWTDGIDIMANRLRDVALLALSAIYCVIVLVADLTIWPGRTPTILLALPILVAALKKPPWFVMAVAVIAVVVDAIDIVRENPLFSLMATTLVALVLISFLATTLAFKRQQAIVRDHRRETVIRTVQDLRQPLTVIVGYTQLLRRRSALPEVVERSLARIASATEELKRLIQELLREENAPSA